MIHSRESHGYSCRWTGSITVSAPQRIDQIIFSTSSSMEEATAGIADVGIDLHEEVPADNHGLGFRMVDVVGIIRGRGRLHRERNSGVIMFGFERPRPGRDAATPPPCPLFAINSLPRAGLIFSDRNELHFRRDDALLA